jgi:replicative DNA helicase
VVVLAARPSVGKSSLAGQMALSVAAQGQSVLMLSQEMPAGELVDRCAANLGRVSMDALTTGRFLEEDWSRMAEAAEAMGRLPLFIDDQPALTLLDIRTKARQVKRRHGHQRPERKDDDATAMSEHQPGPDQVPGQSHFWPGERHRAAW